MEGQKNTCWKRNRKRTGYRHRPQRPPVAPQTVYSQPGRLPGTHPAQDRKLGTAGIYSANGGGAADPGARQTHRQSLPVPSPITREMYHPDSVVNLHKKILKDAALPHICFHDLRHTFATTALQNGVDVKTVSSMLGHYDAGFTLRTYTHATRQKQDEAAATMGSFMAQLYRAEKKAHRTGKPIRCAYILPCEPSASGSHGKKEAQ